VVTRRTRRRKTDWVGKKKTSQTLHGKTRKHTHSDGWRDRGAVEEKDELVVRLSARKRASRNWSAHLLGDEEVRDLVDCSHT
jgi:hypothetical protein